MQHLAMIINQSEVDIKPTGLLSRRVQVAHAFRACTHAVAPTDRANKNCYDFTSSDW